MLIASNLLAASVEVEHQSSCDFCRSRSQIGPPGSNQGPQTLNIDVTKGPIGRNINDAAQGQDYSGKQHGHRLKNTVLCDEYQFIHFTGPTWNGSIHDKTMAAQELPDLNRLQAYQLWLSKDKGYQPAGVHLLELYKAKPKQPLTSLCQIVAREFYKLKI